MAESIFMKAEEVARFLGVSKTEAYRIIIVPTAAKSFKG